MEPSEYPIKDYALIGNCETAALVNKDGGFDWLCFPAFDAPSFFGALLDREKGGQFTVRPTGEFRIAQKYAGDTAILETRFVSEQSTVLLMDFFVIARKRKARFYDFTSLHPTRKFVRLLRVDRVAEGPVETPACAQMTFDQGTSQELTGLQAWFGSRALSKM